MSHPTSCLHDIAPPLRCCSPAAVSLAAQAGEITVSAAASLSNAFRTSRRCSRPPIRAARCSSASAPRARCWRRSPKGAPADVFVSADEKPWTGRRARGSREGRAVPRSGVERAGGHRAHRRREDARRAGRGRAARYARIAIGLPASVPVGRYTKGVLEAAKLWSAIEPKMIGASSVRQALDYVARAEVDAGFVYAPPTRPSCPAGEVAFTVPTTEPILYPIAALAGTPEPGEAAKFSISLFTPPAQCAGGSTASASPGLLEQQAWKAPGSHSPSPQGGGLGDLPQPDPGRGGRLRDGALALSRARPRRRRADAADGDAADGAGLPPAGADRQPLGVIGAWLLQHFGIRLIFTPAGGGDRSHHRRLPLVFKAARAAFENVDPQLEDAARTLGLS